MTDVTLKEFKFALPTAVKVDSKNSENLISSTEFPHEFFGLDPMDQVAVLNGIICAIIENSQKVENDKQSSADLIQKLPFTLGIGVVVRREPKLTIEVNLSCPDCWLDLSASNQSKTLGSICFLLQTAAISIVNRESKLEENNE
jgi:hypothetical protein